MSVSRHHAEWLSLVESSGPFLSLPVLMRVFPQGLDPRDPEQAKQLRLAYEEWQESPSLPGKQRAWLMYVLTQALGHPEKLLLEGQALPAGLTATMAEYCETLRPDIALVGPAGSDLAGKPQLLFSIYPAEQSLEKPVTDKHWKATPGTRMMELLHASDVPLGLVTNGEQWSLVFAPRGDTTGFASWYASLWIDEPVTLRAFLSLLCVRRFFGVATPDTLLALLKESAQDQQEVTNQLGDQVRDAVEVLIQAFDRLDQDSGRLLLRGVGEKNLYDAALTVMMRLVFLFSAEERGLLHLGTPMYDDNYAVSTLREQLQEVADRYGEEVLERRHDAWARLLATFRAVHAGVSHQDFMLPAYGGSLFDPDRYPFLEGRAQGTGWRTKPAEPLEINNRVVLHLLKSLQMLQVKVPGGGPAEALRVSFESLNIEQIGHVYEGLLDHTAVRAKEVVLGLTASRGKPVASMTLSELEALRQQDEAKLIEALEEATDRSTKALEKALKNGDAPEDFHKILIACAQDQKLAERVGTFHRLLRQDSFERPVVVLPGGIYVGQGSARRSTGTHYTPRSLTEPIVQHTLEPLVYEGPSEGLPKEQWRLRTPKEILNLRVCDMAMGSGAFLVQVCRFLSERLVEAWENLEKEHPAEVLITPDGKFSRGERLAIARRLVADRCIFGVDINPMAVEMAKLSIWLITVDKSRPFTFLDHAFKCGDSLLGICRFKQLETFSLDNERAGQVIILSNYDELIRTAITKRRELEMMPSNDTAQIVAKETLLREADDRMEQLNLAADLLISAELAEGKEQKRERARAAAHIKVTEYIKKSFAEFRRFVNEELEARQTFHWPLEFPEIFQRGGFDAIVGNPPFVGGKRIKGAVGSIYREYLVLRIGNGRRGNADLCAYFFLRAYSLLGSAGQMGLLATNTLAQGETREIGLEQLVGEGATIRRAVPSCPWPGEAALEIAEVWICHGPWRGTCVLGGKNVGQISPFLTESASVAGNPRTLEANADKSFIGSYVLGLGFVLTCEQAQELIAKNPQNRDVVFPYLNGDDINSRPDQSPSRWVINFFDWPLDRSAEGSWLRASEDEKHAMLRKGRVSSDFPEKVAADYPDCLSIIDEKVRPERTRRKPTGEFALRYPLYERWWQYADKRPALYRALSRLERTLIKTQVSPTWAFAITDARGVFDQKVVVLCNNPFGLMQSSIHWVWALEYGSTLGATTYNYNPTDCFETFPFPSSLTAFCSVGDRYHEVRRQHMLVRQEGLTRIHNRINNSEEQAEDIQQLRRLQVELDQAVVTAYGWTDLDLGHGFHETKQGSRFTISESARRVVLDRLLALNHQRYEEEVRAGLHDKKAKAGSGKRGSRKNKMKDSTAQGGLYLKTEPLV